jgi:hypothetical protein
MPSLIAPNAEGEVLFRLPAQAAAVGIFMLGARQFDWHPTSSKTIGASLLHRGRMHASFGWAP